MAVTDGRRGRDGDPFEDPTDETAERFWASLDVAGTSDDVVAIGDDLRPGVLLAAYRHGCFPWPSPGWPAVPWCSPDPRGVLWLTDLHVSRSLRRRLRNCEWSTTVDVAFDAVVAACADRRETWIIPRMADAYGTLHRSGVAHSLEVWREDHLLGGVYGVLTGGIFSGESMFSAETDGSKVALVDLAHRLRAAGAVLLDCQQPTAHLQTMGQVALPRADYLAVLRRVRDRPLRLDPTRLPVGRLGKSDAPGAVSW